VAEIERRLAAEPDTPEGEKLDVLTILMEPYQGLHDPIPLLDPIAAILYYIESRGLSRHDFEPYLSRRSSPACPRAPFSTCLSQSSCI
jgi:HTH-type transcriptional regulator/antitoxin HigA